MRFFSVCLWLLVPLLSFSQDTLYSSDVFTITNNAVYENQYEALVLSSNEIKSNYESTFRPNVKRVIKFKFSINGLDNERAPGMDHFIEIQPEDGEYITPVFTFGESDPEEIDMPDEDEVYLEEYKSITVTFRLDMRKVFREMASSGFYQSFDGSIVRKEEFQGVYIAGEEYPLAWNFGKSLTQQPFQLLDTDQDSIYEVTIRFEVNPQRPIDSEGYSHWKLTKDISQYPRFSSSNMLLNAIYNLALEELMLDIRTDSTFMAGAKWPGVWTRDISYSIYLSLAAFNPEIAQKSLMAKVKQDKIIQDTGTGGSWPVSTDRMTWAIAAWEIYRVTGDQEWLSKSYQIIKNSAVRDTKSIIDLQTGLFCGESSFLDWRQQSYPGWMDPKDIYMSMNLGTNLVHYQTYNVLSKMADLLSDPADEYLRIAAALKNAINVYFWLAQKGYYGQFIYGRNFKTLSQRSESLGEALAILFNVASQYQQNKIIANMPVLKYGVPCFFPQIENVPSYHNNGIWPFVQMFWTWAAAKANNTKAVTHGLASTLRANALFLTNKENFVASTGNYLGTEINSDRQLWSVAGSLALYYRVLFGMDFENDGIYFSPFIPESFKGKYELQNFKYRDAVLNISVEGFGNTVDSLWIDDVFNPEHKFDAELIGIHSIKIKMSDSTPLSSINLVENHFTPSIQDFELDDDEISWAEVENDPVYIVVKNGKIHQVTNDTEMEIPASKQAAEYQVMSVDKKGYGSFLSEPQWTNKEETELIFQADNITNKLHTAYEGYSGEGYIPLTTQHNTTFSFYIEVNETGFYALDCRYANGNGPINTDNKCAIRTLLIDEREIGIVVMPQRGLHQWTDWGYSNCLKVHLVKGNHTLQIQYNDYNENMNVTENVAFLDHVRLRLLSTK